MLDNLMSSVVVSLALVASCVYAHPTTPEYLSTSAQQGAVVQLEISCDEITGGHSGYATGVIVSSRHVVTAAHAVGCGQIPLVRATTWTGQRQRMSVIKDDRMFGNGRDLALLEINSREHFTAGQPPPVIDPSWQGDITLVTTRGVQRGYLDHNLLRYVTAVRGDSGSPVFTADGALVGVLVSVRKDGNYVRHGYIERLNMGWSYR